MDYVAKYLGMPSVAVYEVATFYSMYNLKPTGRYKLTLCTCLPCGLQGALDAGDHLREKLGIDFNETTPDGRFTLKEGECMGACAMAPVLLVNNKKMHDYMSQRKARSADREPEMMLDYGPDAILMKGLDGQNWRLEGLRGARRLCSAEENSQSKK